MLNIVIFGPPGAGKGTQAIYLKENFKLVHLSTGELLRHQIAEETAMGVEAKSFIDKGELVPDELVIGMIESKLNESSNANGFIFDGFPRTVDQAKALDLLLDKMGTPVSAMLALEVNKEELISRLLERGKTSGRSDDTDVSIIENRINIYNEKTAPLINYYQKQNKFQPVNGVGSINEIAVRLDEIVKNL